MVDKEAVGEHMYKNTFSKKRYIPRRYQQSVATFFARPISWALNSTEPIPVYREGVRQILKTIQLTVDAMQSGDNILLFPEDPDTSEEEWYPEKGVASFFTGFAHIGKSYYKQTGDICTFYPVYASKTRRIIAIGEGIKFDPTNDAKKEKVRITDTLHQAMITLSNQLD
jgi:1-acyl-sn-glycerol-3-phosphate acyltransferase